MERRAMHARALEAVASPAVGGERAVDVRLATMGGAKGERGKVVAKDEDSEEDDVIDGDSVVKEGV